MCRNTIVNDPRSQKLRDSLFPVLLCCNSREFSAASKDRKGLTKDLNCRNSYEVICGCDIDEELEFYRSGLRQGFRIVNLFADAIPLFEIKPDLVVVIRKRKIVMKWVGARIMNNNNNGSLSVMRWPKGTFIFVSFSTRSKNA